MLQQLEIKNYAIIDELSVCFSSNLNVITGETGAGKSILLGALSLILGSRADMGAVRDPQKKAVIEGVFKEMDAEEIRIFFEENDLDYSREVILRREITPSGKSRAFINDTPVTLRQLSLLGEELVDLHQQFDTLQLGRASFQINILDLLAGQKKTLEKYRDEFSRYEKKKEIYKKLREQSVQLNKEQDYNQFLFDELEEADFQEDELEYLEEELKMQTHVEDLKQGVLSVVAQMEEEDAGVLPILHQMTQQLRGLTSFHKLLPEYADRLSSVSIELEDLKNALEQLNEEVEYDEERLDFIQNRLNVGYKLLKKHQLQTTGELLNLKKDLENKLQDSADLEEKLIQAKEESETSYAEAKALALTLSKNRKKQIPLFTKALEKLLGRVGMPNARLRVLFEERADLSEMGKDNIEFEFDANKSGRFLPIRKVASGGELSRLMLCIKSLIADSGTLPTLVFDEIESGISGEAARQVGLLLAELGKKHQVLCISHQPQVAAKAQTHFMVYKEEKEGRISSKIRRLKQEERIKVIAEMMSGDRLTKASLASAEELLRR